MEAKKLYQDHNLDFERDLSFYLVNGVVISRPDYFIMAKAIDSRLGEASWHPQAPDCWYVACAVGRKTLAWFLSQAPYQLPLIAWKRFKSLNNPLKIYSAERFARLTN